jgi:hypothetical protein
MKDSSLELVVFENRRSRRDQGKKQLARRLEKMILGQHLKDDAASVTDDLMVQKVLVKLRGGERQRSLLMALAQSQSLALFDKVADDFPEIEKSCGELFPENLQLGTVVESQERWSAYLWSRIPEVLDIVVGVGTDLKPMLLTVCFLQTPSP